MNKTLDRKLVQRSEEQGEEMDKKVGSKKMTALARLVAQTTMTQVILQLQLLRQTFQSNADWGTPLNMITSCVNLMKEISFFCSSSLKTSVRYSLIRLCALQ